MVRCASIRREALELTPVQGGVSESYAIVAAGVVNDDGALWGLLLPNP